jgi:tellurite resistance protein TehA-like permease
MGAARALAAVPPSSGAVVMGTGIVSVDLSLDRSEALSRLLLVVAAVVWVGLGLVVADRLLRDRPRARLEAGSPAALTGIAGTAVVGGRVTLLGWHWVGGMLLALALALWLALVPCVLRRWVTPTVGVSFMLVVSTESLAVLAAVLSVRDHLVWLAVAALVALGAGLIAYCFVLARFDLRHLLTGYGGHWVAGGALAIAALACGRIAQAAHELGALHELRSSLDLVALALWAAAILWLSALLAAEILARRLENDARRWSTVFPVGMYAACSFVVGDVKDISGLTDFARVWTWFAVALWLVVAVASLRRSAAIWREDDRAMIDRGAAG